MDSKGNKVLVRFVDSQGNELNHYETEPRLYHDVVPYLEFEIVQSEDGVVVFNNQQRLLEIPKAEVGAIKSITIHF